MIPFSARVACNLALSSAAQCAAVKALKLLMDRRATEIELEQLAIAADRPRDAYPYLALAFALLAAMLGGAGVLHEAERLLTGARSEHF